MHTSGAAFWAKTNPYKGLMEHMLDTGAMAHALLTQGCLRPALGWMQRHFKGDILACACAIAALHDIGKCNALMQVKAPDEPCVIEQIRLGMTNPEDRRAYYHEMGSKDVLRRQLASVPLDDRTVYDYSMVPALHHQRAGSRNQSKLYQPLRGIWEREQDALFDRVCAVLQPSWQVLQTGDATDAACVLLWGITVLSDWLASGQPAFQALPEGIDDAKYYTLAKAAALVAMREAGLAESSAIPSEAFAALFPDIGDVMRPLQRACDEAAGVWHKSGCYPILTLLEAPMGEGKTEAALLLASALMHGFGKSGCYFALPTAATSNNMYGRIKEFLARFGKDRVRLMHGQAWMIHDKPACRHGGGDEDSVEASAWLAPMRRAMLGAYGVGTVDQAMMAALRLRYTVLRMLGLSGKVLIIDEIHAYDAYMQQILSRLLSWCAALDIPVILLSATLPTAKRRALFEACGCTIDAPSTQYPLITQGFADGTVEQTAVCGTYMRMDVLLECLPLMEDLPAVAALALARVERGGCLCVLVNTVNDAQRLYRLLSEASPQNVELFLFHARFPMEERVAREASCVAAFGKHGKRPARAVLVATQVVEQSIDLDMDELITMLCPIDLLFQRLGRMHRHERTRPDSMVKPRVTVLTPLTPLEKTASAHVYAAWILRKTLEAIAELKQLRLPDDIRPLVERVYSAQAVDDGEYAEWARMVFSDDIKEQQALRGAFPKPAADYFFMAEQEEGFSEDVEAGVPMSLGTRYDENRTVTVALAAASELEYARDCPPEAAKALLRRSVAVPRWWFGDNMPQDAKEGAGLLRGLWLLPDDGNGYRLARGIIRNDAALGIVKEDEK